jgi:hypothetical protein
LTAVASLDTVPVSVDLAELFAGNLARHVGRDVDIFERASASLLR